MHYLVTDTKLKLLNLIDNIISSKKNKKIMSDKVENPPKISKLSKFLTLVLRHQPYALGLELDSEGWLNCSVDELVELINEKKGFDTSKDDIKEIVESDPKGRYEISDNLIRATYGHSVKLNPLEYPDDLEDLPEYLYYATNNYQLDTMLRLGLLPREGRDRQFLHLSVEIKDAYTVAKHHSRNPKLVKILVSEAFNYGIKFRKVAPLIVVCEEIPSQFIEEIPLPEELQHLTQLNPERKYRGQSGRRYSDRSSRGSNRRPYDKRRGGYSSSRPRSVDYTGKKRSYSKDERSKSTPIEKETKHDIDIDSPADFGDVDDIKKKSKNKGTIHFETTNDEDVKFD